MTNPSLLDYRLHEYNNAAKRKRLYKVGLRIFNEDPKEGIQFFIDNYIVDCNPSQIASLLVNTKNYSKTMIGEFLGDRHQLCRDTLKAFCEQLDFTDMPLDEALRTFQSHIRITGEAQKIDRLMEAFAARYTVCNIDTEQGKSFTDPDSIFALAFAIIMLNTDLHNENLRLMKFHRMTEDEFVNNIKKAESKSTEVDDKQIEEGATGLAAIDETLLRNMYNRIKNDELKAGDDFTTNVKKIEDSIVGKNKPNLSSTWRRMACYVKLQQVIDHNRPPTRQGQHSREVFLLCDMILVTKIVKRKNGVTNYQLRKQIDLDNVKVTLFQTADYNFGFALENEVDGDQIMLFNALTNDDRERFTHDLKEAITEVKLYNKIKTLKKLRKQAALNENKSSDAQTATIQNNLGENEAQEMPQDTGNQVNPLEEPNQTNPPSKSIPVRSQSVRTNVTTVSSSSYSGITPSNTFHNNIGLGTANMTSINFITENATKGSVKSNKSNWSSGPIGQNLNNENLCMFSTDKIGREENY